MILGGQKAAGHPGVKVELLAAGVGEAGYILLRLPLEVRDLFVEWLENAVPDRASRVMSLINQTRGGKDYQAEFGKRMRGTGPLAWTIGRRFELAAERNGLNRIKKQLRTDLFSPPVPEGGQMTLF